MSIYAGQVLTRLSRATADEREYDDVRIRNIMMKIHATNCAEVAYWADSLWVEARERPDLSPLPGWQSRGHTEVISE
jgi:hypothetical protein